MKLVRNIFIVQILAHLLYLRGNPEKIASWAKTPFYPPYYSQYGQDKYLNEHVFHNQKNGVFVEIGAYDGITYSNSLFFEKELGWTGLCIEPHAKIFPKLKQNRAPKTLCLPIAISCEQDIKKFLCITGGTGMLSGLLNYYTTEHYQRARYEANLSKSAVEVAEVSTLPLKSVLDKYNIKHIDLLSIDTEGGELEILQSIDFSKVTIQAIIVESKTFAKKIETLLNSKGYKKVCTIEIDDIYLLS